MPRIYSDEFKQDAVALVESGIALKRIGELEMENEVLPRAAATNRAWRERSNDLS